MRTSAPSAGPRRAGYDRPVIDERQVIVIGGGIAGLATAYELHQRQIPFTLLRSESACRRRHPQRGSRRLHAGRRPDALLIQSQTASSSVKNLASGHVSHRPRCRASPLQRGGRLHALPQASVLYSHRGGPFIKSRLFRGRARFAWAPRCSTPGERAPAMNRLATSCGGVSATKPPLTTQRPSRSSQASTRAMWTVSIRALFPAFPKPKRGPAAAASVSLGSQNRRRPKTVRSESLPGGLSEMVRALEAALPADSIRKATAAAGIQRLGTHFRRSHRKRRRTAARRRRRDACLCLRVAVADVAPDAARTCGEILCLGGDGIDGISPRRDC